MIYSNKGKKILALNTIFRLPDDFTGDRVDALQVYAEYMKNAKKKETFYDVECPDKSIEVFQKLIPKSVNFLLKFCEKYVWNTGGNTWGLCSLYRIGLDEIGKPRWENVSAIKKWDITIFSDLIKEYSGISSKILIKEKNENQHE